MEEKRRRRFSEQIKKDYVSKIDREQLTVMQVAVLCDVSRQSVYQWKNKYSKNKTPGGKLIVDMKDVNHYEELEKENDNLTRIIGEMQVRLVCRDELLKIACKELGADFEKKMSIVCSK